jgi:thioredoxin reductase
MYDVIIVGGGMAGLSAALILGRCRRKVMIFDTDRPRNAASQALHGFLSRDGISPFEMRRLGREQLLPYSTVEFRWAEVIEARNIGDGFEIVAEDGGRFTSRVLLLATGISDELPAIEGLETLYGRSAFHCPYCDGWERRDQAIAVYGRGEEGTDFALELRRWSDDIVLCTHGIPLPADQRDRLARHGISLRQLPIARLEGTDGQLQRIVFDGEKPLPRQAFFFLIERHRPSPLATKLGCEIKSGGTVETGRLQETGIPGLYLAGDAARSVKLAIIAAAEGAEAAFAIDQALRKADLR